MPLAAFPKCYVESILVDHTMTVDEWVDLAGLELDIDGLELYWPLIADFTPKSLAQLRARGRQPRPVNPDDVRISRFHSTGRGRTGT